MNAGGAAADRHWLGNRRLAALSLLVWFVVSFAAVWFARELNFRFFGWPFSFWLAAQGSLVVYLLIVWWYARSMQRLDRECGVADDD